MNTPLRSNFKPPRLQNARLAFLGDLALNDAFVQAADKREQLDVFGSLLPYLRDCDFLFANWEMAMQSPRENTLKVPRVITTPLAAKWSLQLPLTAVSLANNHIYDCCEEGFRATIDFLNSNKIHYVGAGVTPEEARQPLFLKVKELNVCLLAYVDGNTNPNLPKGAHVFLNWFNLGQVQQDISLYRPQCDLLIVAVHWSASADYFPFAAPSHRRLGRQLVKMGVNLVIGGHPHQLQGMERYQDGLIVYSLGNTIFSDIGYPQAVQRFPPSSKIAGLALVDYHHDRTSYSLIMTKQSGLKIHIIPPRFLVRLRNLLLFCPVAIYPLVWWSLRILLYMPKQFIDRPDCSVCGLITVLKKRIHLMRSCHF